MVFLVKYPVCLLVQTLEKSYIIWRVGNTVLIDITKTGIKLVHCLLINGLKCKLIKLFNLEFLYGFFRTAAYWTYVR